MVPDPQFSTVVVPNPEEPEAFEMALELARREKADIALATDPDGDRVGCAVRDAAGSYIHLTGNQIGALLLNYLLERLAERKSLPPNAVMIKTIVTGDLGRKVAEAHGVGTIETPVSYTHLDVYKRQHLASHQGYAGIGEVAGAASPQRENI